MKIDLQHIRHLVSGLRIPAVIMALFVPFWASAVSASPNPPLEPKFSPWPVMMLGGGVQNCPSNARSLRGTNRDFVCRCSASATSGGSVWGTDTYTDDSRICRAALHRGAVSTSGGNVRVRITSGRSSYRGSSRNGVKSGDWGRWDGSFTVVSAGRTGSGATVSRNACPATATQYRGSGRTISCGCSASATSSGSVWGNGVYTDDSRICRAARHAGVIGAGGGNVTFRMVGPRRSYQQSSANGVSTGSYGSWQGSFSFTGGRAVSGGSASVASCPSNATAYRGSGRTVACRCAGSSNYSGSVWGTDIYTDDSNICKAAVHAGWLGRAGAVVRFQMVGSRNSYQGSTRRGISSSNYGAWHGSFRFVN